ncbi:MAG: antibiotic biosynthesis monooxygenase [Burkholderiales bacterium]
MVLTVFRSRLRSEALQAYQPWAARMNELARTMPGYVSHKTFTADDGERVTLVEFESEAAQRAWAIHPEHLDAQHRGRSEFYSEFRIQVCSVVRESRYAQKK